MKIGKIILLNIMFILLLSIGVSAASKYIVDDAKVLKQDTINTIDTNLSKIEKNTEVIVKFDVIKSLNGKDIEEYAKQYAKDNIKGDQYILFVSSIGDRKNKILVGEKANSILSKSEVENIVSLPNADFKVSNFDAGIMKVGKALDEKVTTKAVAAGKAEIKTDNYSTTVSAKTNWFKVFGILLLIVGIGVVIFILIKRKADKDYEESKKKFAHENNLDEYLDTNKDGNFRTSSIVGSKPKEDDIGRITYSANPKKTEDSFYHSPGQDNISSRKSDYSYTPPKADRRARTERTSYVPPRTTVNNYNNTTVVHDDNSFVEGMVIGNILADSHNDHHKEGHHYREPERESYKEPEKSYSSNNWDSSPSTSSWDNDKKEDSYSSSSWDSSNSSSDYSSSSWDSGSDSSSSDW